MWFKREESDAELAERLLAETPEERYAQRLATFVRLAKKDGWIVAYAGDEGVFVGKVRRWPTVLLLGLQSLAGMYALSLMIFPPICGVWGDDRWWAVLAALAVMGIFIPVVFLTVFVRPRLRFVSRAELMAPGVLPVL